MTDPDIIPRAGAETNVEDDQHGTNSGLPHRILKRMIQSMHGEVQLQRRRHHTHRKTKRVWLFCILVIVVVALVAGLFWLMSSPRFVNPH
jgi:hypothetical protein